MLILEFLLCQPSKHQNSGFSENLAYLEMFWKCSPYFSPTRLKWTPPPKNKCITKAASTCCAFGNYVDQFASTIRLVCFSPAENVRPRAVLAVCRAGAAGRVPVFAPRSVPEAQRDLDTQRRHSARPGAGLEDLAGRTCPAGAECQISRRGQLQLRRWKCGGTTCFRAGHLNNLWWVELLHFSPSTY